MIRKTPLILLIVISSFNALSQNDSDSNRFFNNLILHNENSKAHLLFVSYGYAFAPANKTFNTNGTQINFGINISKIFSSKMFLGAYVGFKAFYGFSRQNFSNEFISDFNNDFKSSQLSFTDTITSLALKEGINSNNNSYTRGNQYSSIGIIFSPFPDRYGGVLLMLSIGNHRFPFRGEYRDILYPSSQDESNSAILKLRNTFKAEIGFKPYFFFNKGMINFSEFKAKNFFKLINFSFYLERLSFENATFEDKPISNFVNQNFIDKYKNDYHFGLKLSFGFW